MAHIRKVLVPLDGSRPSVAALEYALAFAEDSGASIDVLYVKPPPGVAVVLEEDREAERARASAMEEATERLGDRVSQKNDAGDPLLKILENASAGAYDLIVMGTHGRVGRLHVLLGSVAEGVVRNAPCPVLTVRAPDGEEESFAERLHHRRSIGEQTSSR
jgi:nucleotide-binding universal stress UspA family protein